MSTDWFMPWDEVKMPGIHTESIIRRETMPTEEELEQYITARIDREEAAQADRSLESAQMDKLKG